MSGFLTQIRHLEGKNNRRIFAVLVSSSALNNRHWVYSDYSLPYTKPYPEFGALHEQRIGFSLFLFLCLIRQVVLVACRLDTLGYTDFKPTSQEVHGDTAGTEGRRRAGLGVPRKLLRLGAVRFGNRSDRRGSLYWVHVTSSGIFLPSSHRFNDWWG